MTDTNILIGTPAYNGMVHTDYMHGMFQFSKQGIRYSLVTIGNESLITRARNTLLATFWESEVFTHLLFLDADVFLDPVGLQSMLDHQKDVIGAPVYLKGKDKNGEQTLNTDAKPHLQPTLQSVERVGTAAFMLSRKAVASLINLAREEDRCYQINEMLKRDGMPETHYDVFRAGISNNEYLSEDFWVCKELKQLGYEIFVDTAVYTRHYGVVAFD